MATWSISPNSGATINNSGVFTAEPNHSIETRSWVLTYTDNNGNVASETITQAGMGYVEIAGVKWAAMNVGATKVTDCGLYFQWADTQGYTASQVGSGSGQKFFIWTDYKYNSGTLSSPTMSKYNASDGKPILEMSDDGAREAWNGTWRMPTIAQWNSLLDNTTSAWTSNYEGSGVAGLILTSKSDLSKRLFFPSCGICSNGNINSTNQGYYWSSSLDDKNINQTYYLWFDDNSSQTIASCGRFNGCCIRPILECDYIEIGGVKWATMNIGASKNSEYGKYFQWADTNGHYFGEINDKTCTCKSYKYRVSTASTCHTLNMTKYNNSDNKVFLEKSDDAAHIHMGSSWHMPTRRDWKALIDSTNMTLTRVNNVLGYQFTDKNDSSKTLFLPSGGHASYQGITFRNGGAYWANAMKWAYSGDDASAYDIDMYPQLITNIINGDSRFDGRTIRGVYDTPTLDYVEINGVKWGTMNLGATNIADYGFHFQWADTKGFTQEEIIGSYEFSFSASHNRYYSNNAYTKYNSDGLTTLQSFDDAATQMYWGGKWRMPTQQEFNSLITAVNTAWTSVTVDGVTTRGLMCTDKNDSSKRLFFPAAGRFCVHSAEFVETSCSYWSSSLYTTDKTKAFCFIFSVSTSTPVIDGMQRYFGYSIRPVLI